MITGPGLYPVTGRQGHHSDQSFMLMKATATACPSVFVYKVISAKLRLFWCSESNHWEGMMRNQRGGILGNNPSNRDAVMLALPLVCF